MLRPLLVSLAWALAACAASHSVSESGHTDAAEPRTGSSRPDAGDTAPRPDAGSRPDASRADAPSPADAGPPADAGSPADAAGPPEAGPKPTTPLTKHGIVHRDCVSTPYDGWSVAPGPMSCASSLPCGMECLHASDCDASPFGRCTGGGASRCEYGPKRQTPGGACMDDGECTLSPGGRCLRSAVPGFRACEYPDARFNVYESCDQDSDCALAKDAHCRRELRFSSCQYDGCRVDADCGEGAACICEFADHTCVPAECRSDADCPAKQRCHYSQRATEQTGGLYCTTDADTCDTPSEFCEDEPWKVCAFDEAVAHWACLATNDVPLPRRVRD